MYAINLADWTAHRGDLGLQILLAPVLSQSSQIVTVHKNKIDGTGLVLDCSDERAAAIVEIIRLHYPKYHLRLYRGKSKTWNTL